jgi:hypothetical protein
MGIQNRFDLVFIARHKLTAERFEETNNENDFG